MLGHLRYNQNKRAGRIEFKKMAGKMISSEGVVYHVPVRFPKIKPKVELVITRIIFKSKLKTFWWGIRQEGSRDVLACGRLGVTSMQAAVRAARTFVLTDYKVARTIRENLEKTDICLEEWNGNFS
jgi:hypothetical protein